MKDFAITPAVDALLKELTKLMQAQIQDESLHMVHAAIVFIPVNKEMQQSEDISCAVVTTFGANPGALMNAAETMRDVAHQNGYVDPRRQELKELINATLGLIAASADSDADNKPEAPRHAH